MFKNILRVRNSILYFLCIILLQVSCSKSSDPLPIPPTPPPTPTPIPTPLPHVGEVIMQAFYWDVPAGGTWYNVIESKLVSWKAAGITYIWLPPVSKAQSGASSMGYDPYDYFDFGQYNQHGTVETRFGSEAELLSLLNNATTQGFKLIADIVINHNSGGDWEINPTTGTGYWTKFTPVSGKFNRNYNDFHPNSIHASDEGYFGGFPDLCHNVSNVKDWLWLRPDGVGKYYKNTLGFDGWRFDYVKGFSPDVVKQWNVNVG
ncbi:MAG TPA: alpha-amylase family glycosyl hydrolase, partial [Ferruginibacter sp.]|nr:alpha-amylase family glycosyl hydrolase [Ferruginibacter sp.]